MNWAGEMNFEMHAVLKSIASNLEFCVERLSPTASCFVGSI